MSSPEDQYDFARQKLNEIYKMPPFNELAWPWEEGFCTKWAELALLIARSIFLDKTLRPVIYDPTVKAINKLHIASGFHAYLAECDQADPLIIDGTYLQFSKTPIPASAPKIMITTASKTPSSLAAANVGPERYNQWRPDLFGDEVIRDL